MFGREENRSIEQKVMEGWTPEPPFLPHVNMEKVTSTSYVCGAQFLTENSSFSFIFTCILFK